MHQFSYSVPVEVCTPLLAPATLPPPAPAAHASRSIKVKQLQCYVLNADTLGNKITELKARLQDKTINPDIIVITEVKPKNNRYQVSPVDYALHDYVMFSSNLNSNVGRGIIVYTKPDLNASDMILISPFTEFVSVKIPLSGSDSLCLLAIYKSPDTTADNEDLLLQLLRSTSQASSHVLITGDFNFPGIEWPSQVITAHHRRNEKFLECLRDCFLTQHVDFNTRGRVGQRSSTLDLVLTNEDNMVSNLQSHSPLGKSDHSCLLFNFVCTSQKEFRQRKIFFYDKGDYPAIRHALREENWPHIDDIGLENYYDHIRDKLLSLQDDHIPSKTFTCSRKHKPYELSRNDMAEIKKKHRLWQRYFETKSTAKYRDYTRQRNKVTKIIRKARTRLEDNICNAIDSNPKKFWKYTQSSTRTSERIPELQRTDGSTATTDHEKSEALSGFFASVFASEPEGPLPRFEVQQGELADDVEITQENVYTLLRDLNPNKSPGPDLIHPRMLKECARELTQPLVTLFEHSLTTAQIPAIWKKAKVSALHKKGKRSQPSNYRPISLTCVLCKIMESLVRSNIVSHMLINNLFSDTQFGFISGRSTLLQLLHVMEKWTSYLEDGQDIIVAYLDFQKAFDTVPHRRLLHKIEAYGVNDSTTNWIKTFLTGRTQTVCVNGMESASRSVTSGIPQGSVLGPTLFILYVNELPSIVHSFTYLFADDTKIFKPISQPSDYDDFRNDLDTLYHWTETWLLHFNLDKCKTMHIGHNTPDLAAFSFPDDNSTMMTRVIEEKDLGVYFDSELSFNQHITAKVSKANQILGVIRRTFTRLKPENFKRLFTSLVRPHLEYGVNIWHPHLNRDIKLLEGVQRRGSKLVPDLKNLPYPERLKALELPTLTYRRLRGDLIEVYKVFNRYSTSPDDLFTLHANNRTRGHRLKLQKSRCTKTIRARSFTQRVINNWNSLPDHVVNSPSLTAFKNRLDSHLKHHPSVLDFEATTSISLPHGNRPSP